MQELPRPMDLRAHSAGYEQSEHSTKGPYLGLDALEKIISRQRHSNASCGLEESHEGDSIAAFALSHRCVALLCQRKQRPINTPTPAIPRDT